MSLVGLKRLFPEEAEAIPTGIRFDMSHLEDITDRYFNYLLNNYSIAERENRITARSLSRIGSSTDTFKEAKKQVQKRMTDQLKKIVKYFPDLEATAELENSLEVVKKIKKQEELPLLEEKKDIYIETLRTEAIHDKLTLNFAKSVILSPLFGQVSFLNVVHNSKTISEQKEIMEKDYIRPAILETKWLELLNNETDMEKLRQFLEDHNDYKPFKNWLKVAKKLDTVTQMKTYMEGNIPPCILLEGQLGTGNFEEMIFSPLGTSLDKSLNFSWNLNKKQPVPLSALGRLILFMVPIGASVYQRKIGFGNQSEYENFYGFLYYNDHFANVYQTNNHYRSHRLNENPFEEVIIDVLQESTSKAQYKKQEYMFIEFHSNYDSKKTLLDYYHMPAYITEFFLQSGKTLRWIHRYEYREAFIRSILDGKDPKQILFRYMKEVVNSNRDGINILMAVRERRRFQLLKKGVADVKENSKIVYHTFKQGQSLRRNLLGEQKAREAAMKGVYTAGGDKRIRGIAYRLLNASKAGHRKNFLDTVYRLYLGADMEIPTVLLNVLHERDADFETITSAFISGLLSNDNIEQENGVKEQ